METRAYSSASAAVLSDRLAAGQLLPPDLPQVLDVLRGYMATLDARDSDWERLPFRVEIIGDDGSPQGILARAGDLRLAHVALAEAAKTFGERVRLSRNPDDATSPVEPS